jgi:16S rRNA G1207 methylase RsmC
MNFSMQSTKFVPLKGSPPIPTHVDCPRPTAVVWKTCKVNNHKHQTYEQLAELSPQKTNRHQIMIQGNSRHLHTQIDEVAEIC